MDLSVVIVTLMKLPEAKMAALKKDFGKAGLGLEDFIASIIRHLPHPALQEGRANTREAQTERIETASDLMDFFAQVDVDGKGFIRWEDFLSYIIEQSIALKRDTKFQDCYRIREDYDFPCANHKEYIHRVVWNPLHNRLFCCIGQRVRIFNLFTKELPRARLSCDIELSARGSLDYVGAHDIVYVPEEDLLLVLQINLCVSFYKFMSRQFISMEYIAPAGDVTLSHQQYKIRWSAATQQVITVGNDSSIMAWGLKKLGELNYTLVHRHTLSGHTDVVHAVIFVTDREGNELLVSGGLDRRILFWDVATFRIVKCLSGHRGGITCLAYDGDAQVFSGGYDNEIYVWDVKGSISSPTYKLGGPHKSPLHGLSCAPDTGRLCSLDKQGKAALWDVRKTVALNPRDRFIQVLPACEKDRCSSVEIVAAPSQLAKRFTLNSITMVLAGHRLHLYDCVDPRPPDAPPTMVLYNPESVTILTVHGRGVKVWEACTGQLIKEFVSLSRSDISGLTLDKGYRKLILSNLDGDLCFHNYFNGAMLRQIRHKGGCELTNLMHATDSQLLLTVSSDRTLRVVDELAVSDTDCMLRLVTQAHLSDICVSAFDEDLGLLATGAEDGVLKLWDTEFMCLEGSYTSPHELSALAFAFPYPLLLVGDTMGGLSLVPVRPWDFRRPPVNKPALRWECHGLPATMLRQFVEGSKGQERRYVLSSITCLSLASYEEDGRERQVVYVANSKGVVRAYDLAPVLEGLGMSRCAEADLPGQKANFNSRRKVVRRSTGDAARDGLNASLSRSQNMAATSTIGESDMPPVDDNRTGEACLMHAWVAHEEVVLCMSVLPQPQVLFTSSQDMSVKLWAYNGSALGVLTWGRQADLSQRRFWNFPFDFTERHRSRTHRALHILESLRANHAGTVRRFLGDATNGGVGETVQLPHLTSSMPLRSLSPASPVMEGVEEALGTNLAGVTAHDEHEEEVARIFAQLHGETTWRDNEWEKAGHSGTLSGNYVHAAKEQALHDRHETAAARRRRRRRQHENTRKRDPILQTIKSVDRVVAKYAHMGQQQLLSQQRLYVKGEGAGREEKDPLGCMDVLRAVYEERHHGMYPHLHADRDKHAAQSDFSRALRKLDGLKTLLDEAEVAQANNDRTGRSPSIPSTPNNDELPLSGRRGVRMAENEAQGSAQVTPRGDNESRAQTPLSATDAQAATRGVEGESEGGAHSHVPRGLLTNRLRGSIDGKSGTVKGGMGRTTLKLSLSVADDFGGVSGVTVMGTTVATDGPLPTGPEGEGEGGAAQGGEAAPVVVSEAPRGGGVRKGGAKDGLARLSRPTKASAHMKATANHTPKVQPRRDLMSSREKTEKRVKAKRRFGPYCREDLLDLYDAFRTLDHRRRGAVALRELLACKFIETNPDFRAMLAKSYYGTEGGETKMLNLKQALRLVFPLMGRTERRQVMVLIDMYEHHLNRTIKKEVVDTSDQKLSMLKSLFEVYDRDGSGTVEVWELLEGIKQGRSGAQWHGMDKEIEALVSQFGAKGGLLTFDDFVKVFNEVL